MGAIVMENKVNGKVELVRAWLDLLHQEELERLAEILQAEMERRESRGASRRRSDLSEVQGLRHCFWLCQKWGIDGGHPRRSRRDRREYPRAEV
jgi:hypothetical protein